MPAYLLPLIPRLMLELVRLQLALPCKLQVNVSSAQAELEPHLLQNCDRMLAVSFAPLTMVGAPFKH